MPGLKGRARRRRGAAKASSSRRAPPAADQQEPLATWSLRLPVSVHVEFKRWAREQGRSANRQVEMLIRNALADRLRQTIADDPAGVDDKC
jgi:hypothetical protein